MSRKKTNAYLAVHQAGGPKSVAAALGLHGEYASNAVSNWTLHGRQVPSKYVVKLCELTNGGFHPHDIRPDIFVKRK